MSPGLIQLGAPSDEYGGLVNHILSYYQDNKTKEEIRKMIIHELEYHFGCLDLSVMTEPYKTQFYNDLDNLLDNLDKTIGQKNAH